MFTVENIGDYRVLLCTLSNTVDLLIVSPQQVAQNLVIGRRGVVIPKLATVIIIIGLYEEGTEPRRPYDDDYCG